MAGNQSRHGWAIAAIVTLSVMGCGRTENPTVPVPTDLSLNTQADLSHEHPHQHGEPHRHDHEHDDGFSGAHAHAHAHGHRHAAAPHGGRIISLKTLKSEAGAATATDADTLIEVSDQQTHTVLSRPHLELLSTADGQIAFFLLQEEPDGTFNLESLDPMPATASMTLVWETEQNSQERLELAARHSEMGSGYVTERLTKSPFSKPGSIPEISRVELSIGPGRWASEERWTLDLPTGLDDDLE